VQFSIDVFERGKFNSLVFSRPKPTLLAGRLAMGTEKLLKKSARKGLFLRGIRQRFSVRIFISSRAKFAFPGASDLLS
jgi:hypothetical protein